MRLTGLDILRGIAAFGIVGCHLSLSPRTAGGSLVTALCDFNVGLFAAVAGFLMYGVKDRVAFREYAKKRTLRLIPIYLIWSFIFIVFTAAFDLILDGGALNPKYYTLEFWLAAVFKGGSAAHLWFLISLFYAQLLMALCFGLFDRVRFAPIWIVLGALTLHFGVVVAGWYGKYPIRLLAFLMTGYGIGLFVKINLARLRKYSPLILSMAVVALIAHIATSGIINGFFRDWLAVFPVLAAFAVMDVKSDKGLKFAAFLGSTSMGVYLVHPLITRGMSVVVSRTFFAPYSAMVVAGEWIISWGVTLVVALIMLRTPMVRKLI